LLASRAGVRTGDLRKHFTGANLDHHVIYTLSTLLSRDKWSLILGEQARNYPGLSECTWRETVAASLSANGRTKSRREAASPSDRPTKNAPSEFSLAHALRRVPEPAAARPELPVAFSDSSVNPRRQGRIYFLEPRDSCRVADARNRRAPHPSISRTAM
jgi:hypothetical protein